MNLEYIQRNIETIISDEDLSFMKAVNDFNLNAELKITNILCFWHKKKNLEKKLTELHLPTESKEKAKALFDRIGHCPKKEIVDLCIEEMKSISNGLKDYVNNHIEPLLSQFARVYIDKFSLGYNVSSLAESTNSLFKRDLKSCNYTLTDIQIEINESFKHKSAIERYKDYYARKHPCVLRDTYDIRVSEKVKILLLDSLLKCFRLIKQGSNKYIDPNCPDEIFQVDYPVCECNKLKFAGLPCSHIMRYSIEIQINPMTLVNKRNLLGQTKVNSQWHPCMNELFSTKLCNRIPKQSSFHELNEKEHYQQKQALSHPVKNIPKNKTIMDRYNEIMSEAKEVAKREANSQDKTDDFLKILKNKWNEYSANNDHEKEIFEASGAKIGRPRKNRYKSCLEKTVAKKSSYCSVCHFIGKKSDHPKKNCNFAQMLFEIAKENQTSDKRKKGSICEGFGRKSSECPNIKILKERIIIQNSSNSSE